MLVQTRDKMDLIASLISLWYSDTRRYCNMCGMPVFKEAKEPCCPEPQIGTNKQVLEAITLQNKERRESRLNEYGSNREKTFRDTVSLPPSLYAFLEKHFKDNYNESLFENKNELHRFMKKFRAFTVPERV